MSAVNACHAEGCSDVPSPSWGVWVRGWLLFIVLVMLQASINLLPGMGTNLWWAAVFSNHLMGGIGTIGCWCCVLVCSRASIISIGSSKRAWMGQAGLLLPILKHRSSLGAGCCKLV